MKNCLLIVLVLGIAAAGCGREHATAPEPQRPSWEQLVLSESTGTVGEPTSVLTVRSDGVLTLLLEGGTLVSSRGLLAGTKLDSLARLVDGLPPSSYSAPAPCATGEFVLTVAGESADRRFASGSCDSAAPEALRRLHEFLNDLVLSTDAPRVVMVPFQVLLSGTTSALHQPVRAVLQDQDALARLLREHSPDQAVAVPKVDFSRQIVVAEWVGDCPSAGYSIDLQGAEITQSAWFRLRYNRFAPGPGCAVAAVMTQPFIMVVLDRHPEEILMQDFQEEGDCPPASSIGVACD